MNKLLSGLFMTLTALAGLASAAAQDKPIPVTLSNFVRAETDLYFAGFVQDGRLGKLGGTSEVTPIDKQDVVRMNRDTIYRSGVFDLEAAPVTISLPDAGTRFVSMQIVSEDHYTLEVTYTPGPHTYTREQVGTRYLFALVRVLANPESAEDMRTANHLLDAIKVEQAQRGEWHAPQWDLDSQKQIRDALEKLNSVKGAASGQMFGRKDEVDPVLYLIGAAVGWGGNPPSAAVYVSVFPKENDGKKAHVLTVRDVPVDGFWSISVYNDKGFFEQNAANAYSLNNLTAKRNADGSFTIHFGGDPGQVNYLPVTPGWNYTVRLYRPRKEILDGTWHFPEAEPVN